MNYTDKSERLLKYQKTKAKLTEYDVPKEVYPKFPVNSNDLSFSTVYILSLYAESIIEDDGERESELRPLLVKVAQYFDSAFESKERLQRDQDYLVTGAVAYFLYNDFGCAKVLCAKLDPINSFINKPFQLLVLCLQYLLMSKYQYFTSDVEHCADIYKSIIAYFRSGKENNDIVSLLNGYRQYSFNNGDALDAFYVELLYAVVVFAMRKSAWRLLPRHSGISDEAWKDYLERREAVKILWQSQELLCTHGVLKGENAIVQLPTGVGKTKSIELIIRAAQLSGRTTEVIVVAPLRALCNEITHDLQYAFRKDGIEINQFSDVLEEDYSFGLLSDETIRVSICTPEKLSYIIHHQPAICEMMGLFVLDEAHMFDDGARGVTYEFLVTTIRERLTDNQQLVLLSAVMTNAEDIKQWLFRENGVLATDDGIVSTPKSIGFCSTSDISYYSGDPLTWDFFVPQSLKTQELHRLGKERKPRMFPEKDNARDIALYYGIRLCKNGGAAVYVDTTPTVRTTIERALDIQKRGYGFENIITNTDLGEMEKIQRLLSKYYGEEHAYTVACQHGILPHHSRLPNGVKISVEHALRKQLARFVVCTSTLAQGVNVPIKYLLMTGVSKRSGQMNARSFQNLIGRTARSGMFTEGSIIITNPTLYEKRDTAKDGGKHKWRECCDMFSKSSAEPCTSSLLVLVSKLTVNYERYINANAIVQYILNRYDDADCFDALQNEIIKKVEEAQILTNNASIIDQLSLRKRVLEEIENYFCFIYGTRTASEQDISESVGETLCKSTLAYHLANDEERKMLLSIFCMIEAKVATLSKRQHVKYSAAMTAIDCGKTIEAWISEVDLLNCFYTEMDLLHLLVGLYVKLYHTRIGEEELLLLCQEWIKGTMPLDMLDLSSLADIDQLMAICHKTISYEMSFLVGNIVDLLPENDEGISEIDSSLSLLQRKLKYGVPNLTSVSICESLFWDRYIAISISQIIRNEEVNSSNLDLYLMLNKDRINEYLAEMPSYFAERFSVIINKA